MEAWGVMFGRMFLAHGRGSGEHRYGWRPYVWTRSPEIAEKFGSRQAAELFLRGLPTRDFGRVVPFHVSHGGRAA